MALMGLQEDLLSQVGDALAESGQLQGRVPVTCVVEHALLPEHLADYVDQHGKLTSAQKADEKDLVAVRARHHGVARMLAEGVPEGVVAELNNYDPAYISTLKNTPSMIELINFYRQPKNDAVKLLGEKLRILADSSAAEMQRRLESEPDKVSFSELTQAAKLGFDRTGLGPNSTITNVNEHHMMLPEELRELSREARRRNAERIVDAEVVRNALPKEKQIEDQSTAAGRTEGIGNTDPDPDCSLNGSSS